MLKADQARALLDSIETDCIVGLRDRAVIGLLCYTFARVGAVVGMKVEDYYQSLIGSTPTFVVLLSVLVLLLQLVQQH